MINLRLSAAPSLAPATQLTIDEMTALNPMLAAADGTGRHIFFQASGDGVRNRTINGGGIRATGYYVVAPPSVHASGNLYTFTQREWLDGGAELPKLPQALIDHIDTLRGGKVESAVSLEFSDRRRKRSKGSPSWWRFLRIGAMRTGVKASCRTCRMLAQWRSSRRCWQLSPSPNITLTLWTPPSR
jgi:Bifunctional DNA primase/polymerase, N-terminal